jgi:serine/threonine protein kinase
VAALQNPAPVLDGAFSEEFKDFVAYCLVKSPAERPSAATLLRHPFITAVTGIPPAWTAFVQATVRDSFLSTVLSLGSSK